MKVTKLKKFALAVGSLAILGMGQAFAAPQPFTVAPSAIAGTKSPFIADFVAGTSSELLHNSAPGSASNVTTGSGYLQITGFTLDSNAIFGNTTDLGNTYGAYIKFQLTATGNFAPGTTQSLTQLDFQLYADPGLTTTFLQASVSGNTGTEAAVTGNTADDKLLAFGSLISGTAGVDTLGGVFVNGIQSFNLCSGVGTAKLGSATVAAAGCTSNIGTSYFIAPVPFFALAFDEFNNTTQGVTPSTNGQLVAIRSATGGFDFNQVPEPDTIGLFGIAAAGLALNLRRRKA